MTRRKSLKLMAAAGVLGSLGKRAFAGDTPAVTSRRRPNLIYIVPHDLGRHLGCYGEPVQTPHLDALAESGALMENSHCNSPCCMPSRSCVMTGLFAHHHGCMGTSHGWQLPPERRTIVDFLNEAGYETVLAGMQHERIGDSRNPNRYQRCLRTKWTDDEILAENSVDQALAYLRSRGKSDKPFYLNIGIRETHASIWGETAPAQKKGHRAELYGVEDPASVVVPESFPDNAESRQKLARFNPCVCYLDSQIARFVAELDRMGYGENTLLVFATDHGIYGPRHKTTLYEPGTGVASIWRWKGVIPEGQRISHLVTNVDYTPTFLDAAGVTVPDQLDGRSFLPALVGQAYQPNEFIATARHHHANYDPVRAVRTQDFHYIRNFHPQAKYFYTPAETLALSDARRDTWVNAAVMTADYTLPKFKDWPSRPPEELYDMKNDPGQCHNLAERQEYAGARRDLAAKLTAWMEAARDPVLHDPFALASTPEESGKNEEG